MNLIKGRVRLFCVSNIIVSFACTGFLGTKYYADSFEAGQNLSNLELASDEVIPLSQLGEGEKSIIEEIAALPDVEGMVAQAKKNNEQKESTTETSKKTTKKTTSSTKKTVTKSVVTKKEVKTSTKYTPAVYSEVTGNAVIEYAKKYLGLRYVYAGRSLATGTDCSGFTSLIYREFGVSLPSTVSGQVGKGTYVKKADLQKGDLVFYSSGGKTATHVGLYMGNGLVIHQSNPRDGVKINSVNMMKYITARRVINSTAVKNATAKVEAEKKVETNKIETNNVNTDTSKINDKVENTNIVNNANTESISGKETVQVKENVIDNQVSTSQETKKESEVIMDNKKEDSKEVVKEEVKQDEVTQKSEPVKEPETKIEKSETIPSEKVVVEEKKTTDNTNEKKATEENAVDKTSEN